MGNLAEETIDGLNRWSGHTPTQSEDRRSTERHECQAEIFLQLPEESPSTLDVDERGMVAARSQNISSNGIAFVISQQLPTDHITICFPQDDGQWIRIAGQIVRLRQLTDDRWEYGAKFLRRIEE